MNYISYILILLHRKINYWVSFILRSPASGARRPNVIIVGSHADQLQKKSPTFKEQVSALERFAEKKMAKVNLSFSGFFSLDCRYVDL